MRGTAFHMKDFLPICLLLAYGGGVAPLGDTGRIIVNNVIRKSKHAVLAGGSLCDSILTNIIHYGSEEAVKVLRGPECVRNVATTSIHIVTP